ncbi:MAG: hypothetical protein HYZ36_00865, partial [Pedosphaera parvula]|nr:hypothetical protein [Pedosphaera parvula]
MSRNARYCTVIAPLILLLFCCCSAFGAELGQTAPKPEPPRRPPVRTARVVVVSDPSAIHAYNPDSDRIRAMVSRGVRAVTGKTSDRAAWLSLVSTQDTVGIKVYCSPGPTSGTRR